MSEFPNRYTLGVVYPADERDAHGDTMTAEEIQRAAWKALGRRIACGLMHQPGTSGSGRVVESYLWRGPVWRMKDTGGQQQEVSPGDWLLGVCWDEPTWAAITRGDIVGYSLQGLAKREDEYSKSFKAKMRRRIMEQREITKELGSGLFTDLIYGNDLRE